MNKIFTIMKITMSLYAGYCSFISNTFQSININIKKSFKITTIHFFHKKGVIY